MQFEGPAPNVRGRVNRVSSPCHDSRGVALRASPDNAYGAKLGEGQAQQPLNIPGFTRSADVDAAAATANRHRRDVYPRDAATRRA